MLGDDIGAVVISVGHYETRCGEAGDDTPKSILPSFVGVEHHKVADNLTNGMEVGNANNYVKTYTTGDTLLTYKPNMNVYSPFQAGEVDWELYFELVSQSFKTLHIDPAEHPLLFTEPSYSTTQFRTQLIEKVFETYRPPGFFVAKEATLSCYASGRATSLVVDSGSSGTRVCAVHDGYVLKNSLLSSSVAGDALATALYYSIVNKIKGPIRPLYSFKKKKLTSGKWQVTDNNLPYIETFHNFQIMKIIHDIKMSYLKVPDLRSESVGARADFELPDSSLVRLEADSIYLPDMMFKTSGENLGVQTMVNNCISNCDVDIKKDLCGGIIVTGGNTLFPGFVEKLQKNISVPQMYKVKVIAPSDSAERRYSTWTGGSILGSLGSMHAMWVAKSEYEEVGSLIVEKKCP